MSMTNTEYNIVMQFDLYTIEIFAMWLIICTEIYSKIFESLVNI